MKNFGLTPEDYWKLYEYQNGRCYLCQRASGRTKRLAVDHGTGPGWRRCRCPFHGDETPSGAVHY
ncbi:endonuclease domain-containing protein, partial [Mycobacteroides abscessus]|uniref:endonuclease domain-containing protein n=1 Tax=Mycobacteroides abscessus TaxID=36809 RepID=UPI001F264815